MDLEQILSRHLERYFLMNDVPSNLKESIRYSLLLPGKRIRPRLALTTSALLKIPESVGVATAVALEMIHCFTLIHDDLPCMDNDDIRRGKPTNHKVFGEGIALLAGDALLCMAIEEFLIASNYLSEAQFRRGLSRLIKSIGPSGVIGGQAYESLMNENSNLEDVLHMHRKKTGALFEAAVLIPLDFSNTSPDSKPGIALSNFAKELGLSFQLVDDLEDANNPKENRFTSIMRFMSPDEIRKKVRTSVQNSLNELSESFSELELTPLRAITNEILGRVK
jgi:geranylgeranyl diphosphate synthase type II